MTAKLAVAGTLVSAALVAIAASGEATASGATRACAAGSERARIGARTVCLREGLRCSLRYERAFRRHNLACTRFVLGFGAEPVLEARWAGLARPLHVPTLAPGSECPTSAGDSRTFESITGWGGSLTAFGAGPVYPILDTVAGKAVLHYRYPPPEGFGTEWGVAKFPWFGDKTFHGRVLIRGRQLDGPNDVRFEDGSPGFTDARRLDPDAELRLENPVGGSPATTRLRAPGCYAYQVDGWRFSRLILFEGVPRAPVS
jgi:hypothetical protein